MTPESTTRAAEAVERELFEDALRKIWQNHGYAFPRKADGTYQHSEAQIPWEVWQAARATHQAAPSEKAAPVVPESGQKLWLWKNGDHFLAFAHEYPCYAPGGDPMTLGEPAAVAEFRASHDRAPSPDAVQAAPAPTDTREALRRAPGQAIIERDRARVAGKAVREALHPFADEPWTPEQVKTYPRKAAQIINAALAHPTEAAPAAVQEAPSVPSKVIEAVSAYGDSRADDDGKSGEKMGAVVRLMREALAATPAPAPAAEAVRDILRDIEQHIEQGRLSEAKLAAERPGYGTGVYTHVWRQVQTLRAAISPTKD